jgi:hypothetical protein
VIEMAGRLQWLVYHTHDSRHSAAGFPDLVLVKPPRLIFAELKAEGKNPTPEQEVWLRALEKLWPHVEVQVWRPSNWASGAIEHALRRQTDRGRVSPLSPEPDASATQRAR